MIGAALLALSLQSAAVDGSGVHALPPAETRLRFKRVVLDERFLCEGASFGDLNGDGVHDVVAGPWWYAGPDYGEKHPLYKETVFDPLHYSDHFFSWVHDFDADGANDVLVVGFPGEEAYWLQNPGAGVGEWTRHQVFRGVDNESPEWTDLTGDGRPELVCMHGGRLGWLEWDAEAPAAPWRFRAATGGELGGKFTHGLGVGDLDGDGRKDLLLQRGWWKQPADLDAASGDAQTDGSWEFVAHNFGDGYGGAQMLVADFDGDGDADVFSSLRAHGWGISWFEQHMGIAGPTFEEHAILAPPAEGVSPGDNFSEPHALALADVDGDGLLDVVTGKRWWSHGPDGKPDAGGPAMLVAFLARRGAADGQGQQRLAWEMQRIDGDSGVGVQVSAGDLDRDGRPDVVVANKHGAWVFLQQEPAPLTAGPDLGFESGTLHGWTATGDAFRGQPMRGDTVAKRIDGVRSNHGGDWWIGGYELAGDAPTGALTSAPFRCAQPWASFLIAGGRSEATRVELRRAADDALLYSCSGSNHETLQRVLVDLTSFQGQDLYLVLVDESSGGWGHLNFDDFRFHAEAPEVTTPRGVSRVHPYPALQQSGMEPQAAARAMTVPEGFQVDLIAGEPNLHQPVALATDAAGRLWVAEAHSYPAKRGPGKGQDKILVFEDKDLDGSYETRTVFADDLDLVSGLAVGFGGVWVGAAPELLFIPDRNRDLVPDGPPLVVLDGFGYQDTHETLNSFTWGPDGWLYGCHGVFTHSKVGHPGEPDDKRVPLNAGVWRVHPVSHKFEVFAWGTSNPWGIDFDPRGQAVITACVIPHLWHMVQGGRYQRQGGSHFDAFVYSEIQTIADHVHYAGNIADHAWWGRDRAVADHGTDLAGGGHAHCGAMIYQESQFPAEYYGSVLMNNIHGNRVNRDVLVREGSGLAGSHAADLLLANDQWYRGIALRPGPDGSVYFIDWYDKNACHRNDREIWDRTNGRLYRLSYGEPDLLAVDLEVMEDAELAAQVRDAPSWWARKARQVLQERAHGRGYRAGRRVDAAAADLLLDVVRTHGDPARRLQALWALHAIDALTLPLTLELLQHEDRDVRAWTVQLATEDRNVQPPVYGLMVYLAQSDPDPAVQLYLASAMQRLPLAQRWSLATTLLYWGNRLADDPNLPNVLWYGIEPLAAQDPARLLAMVRDSGYPQLARWTWRRLAAGDDAGREALVAAIGESAAPLPMLEEMGRGLKDRPGTEPPVGWSDAATRLLGSPDTALRDAAAEVSLALGDAAMGPLFRVRVMDRGLPAGKRIEAIEGLVRLRDPFTAELLLHAHDFPELRAAALRGLAAVAAEPAQVLRTVLSGLPRYDMLEREIALQTLGTRADYARPFLEAVATGEAPRALLDSVVVRRQLQALGDPQVDALLERAWGRSAAPDEATAAAIAAWKERLSPATLADADLPNGRALFARTCQACHVLHGVGGDLGPDITGSNRADVDYLLSNLVAPSGEVGNDYRMTVVRMRDGRVTAGIVAREDERSLVMRTAAGDETLLRRDVAENPDGEPAIDRLAVSLMPPGQLEALSADDARDLVAYLQAPTQVPMRATEATVGSFFNGRDLAMWQGDASIWSVADGEIVGRSADGLEHNAFLASELLLGDFRLVVDVRLVGDQGNSGVQFRSAPVEGGEMRGLQADVGPGWWGKLYEELGRGLLVDQDAPEVHQDGWNRYEIVAVGDRVLAALNGRPLYDRSDPEAAREGVIGLQVHSGGPTEVRFRIVRLELDPEPALSTLD